MSDIAALYEKAWGNPAAPTVPNVVEAAIIAHRLATACEANGTSDMLLAHTILSLLDNSVLVATRFGFGAGQFFVPLLNDTRDTPDTRDGLGRTAVIAHLNVLAASMRTRGFEIDIDIDDLEGDGNGAAMFSWTLTEAQFAAEGDAAMARILTKFMTTGEPDTRHPDAIEPADILPTGSSNKLI